MSIVTDTGVLGSDYGVTGARLGKFERELYGGYAVGGTYTSGFNNHVADSFSAWRRIRFTFDVTSGNAHVFIDDMEATSGPAIESAKGVKSWTAFLGAVPYNFNQGDSVAVDIDDVEVESH